MRCPGVPHGPPRRPGASPRVFGEPPFGAVSLDARGRANLTTMPFLVQGNQPGSRARAAVRLLDPSPPAGSLPRPQPPGRRRWRRPRWVVGAVWALAPAPSAEAQNLFGWPLRGDPQPEAVLVGSRALFHNPGGLGAGRAGEMEQFWIAHVRGPHPTGLRGMAAVLAWSLPSGIRWGAGYWHLGVEDIPRTTTSPEHDPSFIRLAEDGWVVAVGGEAGSPDRGAGGVGVGAGLRLQRARLADQIRVRWAADWGLVVRPRMPGYPLLGAAVRDAGGEKPVLAGLEITLPPLPVHVPPLRVGYGLQGRPGRKVDEHRWSIRASWGGRVQAGIGAAHRGRDGGRVLLWSGELTSGRYFLSVLREALPGGVGTAHFFRVGVSFPRSERREAEGGADPPGGAPPASLPRREGTPRPG